ncbi:hypothetical protein L7F22_003970 [Adiantum nelumboides]|nr:hypothetical protein [Adiantum nelumboides]
MVAVRVGVEWWGEMKRDGMPAAQQARFAAAVREYVMAQATIVRFNQLLLSAHRPPALSHFLAARRVAVGAPLCFLASEYDLGIELDPFTVSHPLVLALHAAISDHVVWLNDILSFPKEFANGDFLNLLSLLHIQNNTLTHNNYATTTSNNLYASMMLATPPLPLHHHHHHHKIPLQLAAIEAWKMITGRQRDCARLAFEIMASPLLATKSSMQAYVDAICSITTGNGAWSLKCSRYNVNSYSTIPNVTSINVPATPSPKLVTMASLQDVFPTRYSKSLLPSQFGCNKGQLRKRVDRPFIIIPEAFKLISFSKGGPSMIYSCANHISSFHKTTIIL